MRRSFCPAADTRPSKVCSTCCGCVPGGSARPGTPGRCGPAPPLPRRLRKRPVPTPAPGSCSSARQSWRLSQAALPTPCPPRRSAGPSGPAQGRKWAPVPAAVPPRSRSPPALPRAPPAGASAGAAPPRRPARPAAHRRRRAPSGGHSAPAAAGAGRGPRRDRGLRGRAGPGPEPGRGGVVRRSGVWPAAQASHAEEPPEPPFLCGATAAGRLAAALQALGIPAEIAAPSAAAPPHPASTGSARSQHLPELSPICVRVWPAFSCMPRSTHADSLPLS